MFRETTINNVVVKPLTMGVNTDPSKVRFGRIFSNPYATCFLVAKRKGGKTSTLATILNKQGDKKTVYWIFCPSTQVDDSWKMIIQQLRDKGNVVNVFDSIMNGKENILNTIIDDLIHPEEEEPKEKEKKIKPEKGAKIIFGDEPLSSDGKVLKEYKPKKIAPEHIFVMDDLSHELKNPAVAKLLKNGRHLKSSVYLSFQYPLDATPQMWKQCEYMLCFRSFIRDKLEHIHRQTDLTMPLDQFEALYDYAHRDGGYNFLFVDTKNQKFRRNFNKEIEFEMLE